MLAIKRPSKNNRSRGDHGIALSKFTQLFASALSPTPPWVRPCGTLKSQFESICPSWTFCSLQDNHEAVAETAVVGFPHPIKGEGWLIFVTEILRLLQ